MVQPAWAATATCDGRAKVLGAVTRAAPTIVTARALAAKVILSAKDSKETQAAKPIQSPVVVHDKVVTWQS